MRYVIRIGRLVGGARTEATDRYVRNYRPGGRGRRGLLEHAATVDRAKRYKSRAAALAEWQRGDLHDYEITILPVSQAEREERERARTAGGLTGGRVEVAPGLRFHWLDGFGHVTRRHPYEAGMWYFAATAGGAEVGTMHEDTIRAQAAP